jgi:hypothetical protein
MLEQVRDFLLQPFSLAGSSLVRSRRRSAPFGGGLLGRQLLADLGHGTQDRLRQFLDDVEFTDLVRNSGKHQAQRLGIERRGIGRDTLQRQVALLQDGLEATQEGDDVLVLGIVIEHLIQDAFEGAIVNERQDAERAIVQFVDGDVAGEIGQGPIKVLDIDLAGRLFPPRPPPSSGW